ncbi:MAG: flavin reductase family protein [Gemmobacter sp.]
MHATFIPDPVNARAFRDALGAFPTGVTVISCVGTDGLPVGITANSFASLSLDPPLILWSPAKASTRHAHFCAARHFSVHVLGADQAAFAARFSRGGEGFHGLAPQSNAEAVPVLADPLVRFDCRTEALHDAGDHTIVVGRVLRVLHRAGDPLVFARGRYTGLPCPNR